MGATRYTFWLAALLPVVFLLTPAYSHGLGFHGVDGEPGPVPTLPDITGPFEAEVTFILRNTYTSYSFQRLFDFCAGGLQLIAIGQESNSKELMLEIQTPTGFYYASSGPVYEMPAEVPITVRAGVEPSGQLWLQIDGESRQDGNVMANLADLAAVRATQLIGRSCIGGDDDLRGSVLGMRISPYGAPRVGIEQGRFQNQPAQILGPFTVSFWARIDNLLAKPNQILFDLSNGIETNNVYMGNYEKTTEMEFCVLKDAVWHCLYWPGAIVEGEVALWHAGITADGTIWMEKNGEITGKSYKEQVGGHPGTWNKEIRTKMQLGRGDYAEDNPLDGFLLGLHIDALTVS